MKIFFANIIAVFFLVIGGVLLCSKVQAQVTCGSGLPACAGGLLCIDEVCNVPPPIWDSSSLDETQNASFDVKNDSRVRGDLTVGEGFPLPTGAPLGSLITAGDIYTNAIKSRRSGVDNIWIGDDNDILRVKGLIKVGPEGTGPEGTGKDVLTNITSNTGATGLIIGGSGSERTVSLRDCAANQILKRNALDTAWICAEDATGGGGAGSEPLFTAWLNNGAPTLTTLKLTAGAGNGRVLTSDANGLGSWRQLPSGNLPVGSANQTLRNNGSGWVANGLLLNNGTTAVGVGALSASYAFNVVGDINATARLCIAGVCRETWPEAGSGGGLIGTGVANKIALWTGASSLGQDTNLHWDFANDRLGVGVSSPVEKLEIRDDTSGTARLRISDSAQNPELQLQYGAGANDHWAIYVDQFSKDLRFWNGIERERFFFSSSGDFVAMRSVNANGCFGPVIVGATGGIAPGGTYDGNLNSSGGYKEVDSICNATSAGSHQCTTEEVMNSIHCGAIWTDSSKTVLKNIIPVGAGQFVWIGNGAPSLPTPTNDCYGWTQNGEVNGYQSRGTTWYFNNDGGASYSRSCAEAYKILCCK